MEPPVAPDVPSAADEEEEQEEEEEEEEEGTQRAADTTTRPFGSRAARMPSSSDSWRGPPLPCPGLGGK